MMFFNSAGVRYLAEHEEWVVRIRKLLEFVFKEPTWTAELAEKIDGFNNEQLEMIYQRLARGEGVSGIWNGGAA
jgi:hypothetical protein